MIQKIRLLMLGQFASFAVASLIHSGVIIKGFEHGMARIAEGVIATVLLAGLVMILARPDWTRTVGLAAQGFALLGTLVGLFTIAIGIGPRTGLDLAIHAEMLTLLILGLTITARASTYAAG